MTQIATRAIALQEAVKAISSNDATTIDEILVAAAKFHDFIVAGEQAAAPAVSKPTAEPRPPKAAAAVKPPAEKVAAPKAAPAVEAAVDPEPPTVGNIVSRLIKAGKRDEAVALLAKYKATSVSGVKAKDQEAFIAEGLEELLTA